MVRDGDKLASTVALEEPGASTGGTRGGELELILIGDLNADGIVDEIDEAIPAQPENNATAIFGPNLDDDDGDGRRDGIDEEVNGSEDVNDLASFGASDSRLRARGTSSRGFDWARSCTGLDSALQQ